VRSRLLDGLALARSTLPRAAAERHRDPDLRERLRDPQTRVLVLRGDRAPVHDRPAPELVLIPAGELSEVLDDDTLSGSVGLLLGVEDASAHVALLLPAGIDEERFRWQAPDAVKWRDLRRIGADLGARDAGLLTTTVALARWHDGHVRCTRCGAPTVPAAAGWVRVCQADGSEHYPRTEPAVIVVVRDDDDRALLGRRAEWAPEWFSALAGFVEAGESAEAAVIREAEEEAGVRVDPGRLEYLGSQPWPFPASLMLGYHAWTSDPSVQPDGEEIADVRWFTRAEIVEACAAGEVLLPPTVSIARHLIERWVGHPLPGDWSRT